MPRSSEILPNASVPTTSRSHQLDAKSSEARKRCRIERRRREPERRWYTKAIYWGRVDAEQQAHDDDGPNGWVVRLLRRRLRAIRAPHAASRLSQAHQRLAGRGALLPRRHRKRANRLYNPLDYRTLLPKWTTFRFGYHCQGRGSLICYIMLYIFINIQSS